MIAKQKISAFTKLGDHLSNLNGEELDDLIYEVGASNTWFTKDSVRSAIEGLVYMLQEESLNLWISNYSINDQNKLVGIIMAGNIPAVGFHDLLCVVISGNKALVKLSSQDDALMGYIITKLFEIEPQFKSHIYVVDQLKDMDAVIATGSDNTSRYFNYYFSKYPHIIRKNRTSCAVITGKEIEDDFKRLGADIFQYFGLGCRNVSKLFVPKGYEFEAFWKGISSYQTVINHHKYSNNYDYNKSIYLVNSEPHLDNGFLLLKKSDQLVSPISVLFYEEYEDQKHLQSLLELQEEKIQCIVSLNKNWPGSFEFGNAQCPGANDYADNIDTMKFLTALS
ncbi:MAG: acyl-CoA reductase [Bacteroidota bacterium]